VRASSFIAAAVAVLLVGCASSATNSKLVYGLGDDELNRLGDRFGYRVEALGMSDYSFTRGNRVFHVLAHNDISARRRLQSDYPVALRYDPSRRRAPIESQLSIERGVPFSVVEEHFAGFIRRIETPAT
jgi:hypothetical protein